VKRVALAALVAAVLVGVVIYLTSSDEERDAPRVAVEPPKAPAPRPAPEPQPKAPTPAVVKAPARVVEKGPQPRAVAKKVEANPAPEREAAPEELLAARGLSRLGGLAPVAAEVRVGGEPVKQLAGAIATVLSAGSKRKAPAVPAQVPKAAVPKVPEPVGAVEGVRGAVQRVVTQNDLKNLQVFIEYASLSSGRMPDKAAIMESLKATPDAAALVMVIEGGTLVLTGINQREGVWAYEKDAPARGGVVLSNNGIERLTAEELNQRLQGQ
jgi:hypothetical protein